MNNSDQFDQRGDSAIAVIGMGLRFPGAQTPEELWAKLRQGKEMIRRLSDEELLAAGISPEMISDPRYVKAASGLEEIENFDAAFFRMSPQEAALTDPQHRLFLECAWQALEDAGYDADRYEGLIGVYTGTGTNRYMLEHLLPHCRGLDEGARVQMWLGNEKDFLATRVSYKLNLRGSSVNVNTACSTSLVAIHLACQSLLSGENDMALAGGVTVRLPMWAGYLYQPGSVASPDGHCRAFDERANGTIFGSGAGVVVLKRLSDARRDGDTIQALIIGSAINNDGSQKVGYTAPSVEGQARVITEALSMAQVSPEEIDYIETHGTGTELGDPIEVAALRTVFGDAKSGEKKCAIGTVKANLGHLDAAAGVAGLIKAILTVKHGEIAPQPNYERANPKLELEKTRFYVNRELTPWKREWEQRRAAVSSFGIGGTNAHVIIEEAPKETGNKGRRRASQVILLSARSEESLERMNEKLVEHLRHHPHLEMADVAWTLQIGRKVFSHRRFLICRGLKEAIQALENRQFFSSFQEDEKRPVAFLFPGGGTQYVNMGRELYETEPIFRRHVDNCAAILKKKHHYHLLKFLYPRSAEDKKTAAAQINRVFNTLPAVFVIEYALAKLWMSWGVHPSAMIGHSLGEYVVACLAGVFSLEDALALVILRGRLLEQLPRGGMLSLPLSEPEVRSLIDGKLSLAAVNSPSQCVVSGAASAIEELVSRLTEREIEFRYLPIEVAGHSKMVEPILEPFANFLKRLQPQRPQIAFISNLSGEWITEAEATDPMYWVAHMRQTVRFGQGINRLLQDSRLVLLEVGPGQTLSSLTRLQADSERAASVLASMRHPKEHHSDVGFLLTTLGKLWMQGVHIDWRHFHSAEERRRIPLPSYQFERKRYWIEPDRDEASVGQAPESLKKKAQIADWFYVPLWRQTLLPCISAEGGNLREQECWLLFLDDCGVGEALARRLREQLEETVITVSIGSQFARENEGSYLLRPDWLDDYLALLADLRNRGMKPKRMVHLWSITDPSEDLLELESLGRTQARGFYSLLSLAKATGILQMTEPLWWMIVTSDAQAVTGEEKLAAGKATILGLAKVIPQEYPHITCRSADLTLSERTSCQQSSLIDELMAEIMADSAEKSVAWRGGRRWTQTFEAVRLGTPERPSSRLREGGVYLITGGLGNIGSIIAEHLARVFRARLVIVTQSPLPRRSEWDAMLSAGSTGEENRTALKINRLRRLESAGAELIVIVADVADESQMREVVATANRRFGMINGVIHAAGSKVTGTVQEIQLEDCERQFLPKIQGLFVLEKVLEAQSMDFCLIVSSLSSMLGVIGMAAYSSAHLFMDTFVERHNRTSDDQWISVNWDNWRSGPDDGRDTPEAGLFMFPEEGQRALDLILASNRASQLIISTASLQARLDRWIGLKVLTERAPISDHATPKQYPRPALKNPYIPPTSEVERVLAEIWQRTLGITQVGITDNYFNLGGDSVMAIHLVARARQAGISLAPKQLFLHQTIAELAVVAKTASTGSQRQEAVIGPVVLTPIQRWFFEQEFVDPHHWNLSLMLEVRGHLKLKTLEEIFGAMLACHDALRLRYRLEPSGWSQSYDELAAAAPVWSADLSELPEEMQEPALEASATALQKSLPWPDGPLMRVAYFDYGRNRTGRLVIILHHLIGDAVSWRILLEDLETAYQQATRKEKVQLPPQMASFQHWGWCLTEYVQTEAMERELDFWLSLPWETVAPLPRDHRLGPNTVSSAATISLSLSVDETRFLLQVLPGSMNVRINDVLLTALEHSLWRWTQAEAVLIDLEAHGREEVLEGIDLSRTVGWFTAIFPVILSHQSSVDLRPQLNAVKDALQRLPHRGIGYGILRYLGDQSQAVQRLRRLPQAEISFLYFGQFDQVLPASSPFALSSEPAGATRSPQSLRPYLIEVTSIVLGGKLQVNWTYSRNLHRQTTIANLAGIFQGALQSMMAACQSVGQKEYTAADFPGARMSQEAIDAVMARIKRGQRN